MGSLTELITSHELANLHTENLTWIDKSVAEVSSATEMAEAIAARKDL